METEMAIPNGQPLRHAGHPTHPPSVSKAKRATGLGNKNASVSVRENGTANGRENGWSVKESERGQRGKRTGIARGIGLVTAESAVAADGKPQLADLIVHRRSAEVMTERGEMTMGRMRLVVCRL
jgi:hypothetical protein